MSYSSDKIPLGFRIIGIFKLVSAALLLAASFGIFRLVGQDVGEVLEHFVRRLHLDPERHIINTAISWAAGIDENRLHLIGAATLFYAGLYVVEGIGILRGRHWAEYLIIVATGLLLPVEVYEVIEKLSTTRVVILVINVAVVAYLVWQLLRERKRRLAKVEMIT